MTKTVKMTALALLVAVSIFAADPTGKWAATMPGRDGNSVTITFDLKADSDKPTGKVSTPRGDSDISDGKVDGDKVMFSVVREFNGNTMKQNYTGIMEGETIHFTVVREGGQGPGGERKMDAKKQ